MQPATSREWSAQTQTYTPATRLPTMCQINVQHQKTESGKDKERSWKRVCERGWESARGRSAWSLTACFKALQHIKIYLNTYADGCVCVCYFYNMLVSMCVCVYWYMLLVNVQMHFMWRGIRKLHMRAHSGDRQCSRWSWVWQLSEVVRCKRHTRLKWWRCWWWWWWWW